MWQHGDTATKLRADHKPKCLVIVDNTAGWDRALVLATIANTMGAFPIPMMIVPGELSDPEVDALS